MARSDGPRTAVTRALTSLRQVRDERRIRRAATRGTDPRGTAGPTTDADLGARPRQDIADKTTDTVPTGADAVTESTSREGHEPAVDDRTRNETPEDRATDPVDAGTDAAADETLSLIHI